MPFTPSPRWWAAAAVAAAIALLGAFTQIVHQAAVAGPSRYLPAADATTAAATTTPRDRRAAGARAQRAVASR